MSSKGKEKEEEEQEAETRRRTMYGLLSENLFVLFLFGSSCADLISSKTNKKEKGKGKTISAMAEKNGPKWKVAWMLKIDRQHQQEPPNPGPG